MRSGDDGDEMFNLMSAVDAVPPPHMVFIFYHDAYYNLPFTGILFVFPIE